MVSSEDFPSNQSITETIVTIVTIVIVLLHDYTFFWDPSISSQIHHPRCRPCRPRPLAAQEWRVELPGAVLRTGTVEVKDVFFFAMGILIYHYSHYELYMRLYDITKNITLYETMITMIWLDFDGYYDSIVITMYDSWDVEIDKL